MLIPVGTAGDNKTTFLLEFSLIAVVWAGNEHSIIKMSFCLKEEENRHQQTPGAFLAAIISSTAQVVG